MSAEQNLVDRIVRRSRSFHEAVDTLVSQLLCEAGNLGRSTDGVLFTWETIEEGRASGTGLVVLIERQTVQPLRVEFVLDATGSELASGFVHFGNADLPDVPYGSPPHHKMVRQILANPLVEFPWIERFHRDMEGWHRALPAS
ncbi:MAG: hypothetical protein H6834_12355 [Planctomycetes bacterium]|nr:hypothetical protein [Planctomycetota bacterium]